MRPVLFALAKLESFYIEEWVQYHLTLGFEHIYIYDNEDTPTYEGIVGMYKNVTCIHMPGNTYERGIHYVVLDDFVTNRMYKDDITHVANIDIDEFIVLKKHDTIQDFIREYIHDDCVGIGMNWRLFGSSGHTDISSTPVTVRFTRCEALHNIHVKTLFDVQYFKSWYTMHFISTPPGFFIKDTSGSIITSPFNPNGTVDVIQLNHYKCKTFAEFKRARARGRAGLPITKHTVENIEKTFAEHNKNDVEDTAAKVFYLTRVLPKVDSLRTAVPGQ